MVQLKGTIGAAEIVSDGIIIGGYNEALTIFPVPDDIKYSLQVKIEIDHSGEVIIPTTSLSDSGGPMLTIKRGWHNGEISANTDLLIGETSTERFYMNFTLVFIGDIDRYAAELRYVVCRKAKA